MCKKLLCFLTLMTSVFLFSACSSFGSLSDSDMNIYEKIHSYYNKMESYSANLEFTVYSNKTENQYKATEKALGNDRFYIKTTSSESDLSVTTISNGDKTKTVTEGSDYSVTLPSKDALYLLFVNTFFKTYYASEETVLTVNKASEGNVTILETSLSPISKNAAKILLSINNDTLAPEEITVYNISGNPWIKGKFSNFKYNDKEISESVFCTD